MGLADQNREMCGETISEAKIDEAIHAGTGRYASAFVKQRLQS
jgi:hypothetical protein